MSHVSMSRVTLCKYIESEDLERESVSRITHVNEACIYMSHVTRMNESCHIESVH